MRQAQTVVDVEESLNNIPRSKGSNDRDRVELGRGLGGQPARPQPPQGLGPRLGWALRADACGTSRWKAMRSSCFLSPRGQDVM